MLGEDFRRSLSSVELPGRFLAVSRGKGRFTILVSNTGGNQVCLAIPCGAEREFAMFRRLSLSMLAVASLSIFTATASPAGTEIVVMADEAKLVSVGGDISTVVVGNPAIADATVQGQNVFIHGRSYGSTNLIVLDKEGSQIANLGVTVMQGGNSNLTVFRGGGKYSYVCEPQCQVALRVGDKPDFFDSVESETTKKIGISTGLAK